MDECSLQGPFVAPTDWHHLPTAVERVQFLNHTGGPQVSVRRSSPDSLGFNLDFPARGGFFFFSLLTAGRFLPSLYTLLVAFAAEEVKAHSGSNCFPTDGDTVPCLAFAVHDIAHRPNLHGNLRVQLPAPGFPYGRLASEAFIGSLSPLFAGLHSKTGGFLRRIE